MEEIMETINAKVTFIDAFGRAVVLTERNEALILDVPRGANIEAADNVLIQREDGHRRKADWIIAGRV